MWSIGVRSSLCRAGRTALRLGSEGDRVGGSLFLVSGARGLRFWGRGVLGREGSGGGGRVWCWLVFCYVLGRYIVDLPRRWALWETTYAGCYLS